MSTQGVGQGQPKIEWKPVGNGGSQGTPAPAQDAGALIQGGEQQVSSGGFDNASGMQALDSAKADVMIDKHDRWETLFPDDAKGPHTLPHYVQMPTGWNISGIDISDFNIQPDSPYPEPPADDASKEEWDKYQEELETQRGLEEKYGPAEGRMTEEEWGNYKDFMDNVETTNGPNGEIYYTYTDPETGEKITTPGEVTTDPETGVTTTKIGPYTISDVPLYDGKTWDQLSPAEQQEQKDYEAEKAERQSELDELIESGMVPPETTIEEYLEALGISAPFEKTSQRHVQKEQEQVSLEDAIKDSATLEDEEALEEDEEE